MVIYTTDVQLDIFDINIRSTVMPPEMVPWLNCTCLAKTLNLNGRGH